MDDQAEYAEKSTKTRINKITKNAALKFLRAAFLVIMHNDLCKPSSQNAIVQRKFAIFLLKIKKNIEFIYILCYNHCDSMDKTAQLTFVYFV